MLKKTRRILALIFLVGLTALFLDFTGTLHAWLGWMAKVQFLPALLALNVGVVAALVALTLVAGRVYCSVICPLGVTQDLFAWLGGRGKKRRYRFSYSPEMRWLRLAALALFAVAMVAGLGGIAALLAPYSAFGRIVTNLLSPLYRWGNNLLAYLAERADSYAFYETEVWMRGLPTFLIALATLVILAALAWRNGRTYCNTICPVGTVLGYLSKLALFRVRLDASKCTSCQLCARQCKAACIDVKNHTVDYSRCVSCMDCLDTCKHDALHYTLRKAVKPAKEATPAATDTGRRGFIATTLLATGATLRAQEKKVDGGLAVIVEKKAPRRETPIAPPGSLSLRNLAQHCTACQLCVSACPNDVLRPSTSLSTMMQPVMSYERGYCRPECVRCSEVCPTGAILPITPADKSAIRVGRAVWVKENCVPRTDGQPCDNCARHCPTKAIQMVPSDPADENSLKIPVVNEERCIGCGACENLCPARPFSAMYVEGVEVHSAM